MKDMKTMSIIHSIEDLDIIVEQLDAVAASFGTLFIDDTAEYCAKAVNDHFDRYEALYAVITRYIVEIGESTKAILEMADTL